MRMLLLVFLVLGSSSAIRRASAETMASYAEACDASAAVAIGKGRFVVADDEGNLLRIYERGTRAPVGQRDLTDHLGNRKPSGKAAEADIEGAAVVGTRIYWLSSHARKKDGEKDPFRYRLFATDIDASAGTVTAVGMPYRGLLGALVERFPVLKAAANDDTKKPEDEGGFNIEGLAAAADGSLLIGFRNPVSTGRALVVPLRNPADLIEKKDATPVFADLIELDLGGHGIRSFDRIGDEYWIVAGPYASSGEDPITPHFALFRWKGDAASKPVFVQSLEDGTFRAEAMFVDDGKAELVLLSDDGDEMVGEKECKDKEVPAAKKSFRARTIPLPAPGGRT